MNKSRLPLCLAAAMLLAGCVSERVILLPSADGQASAMVLRNERGELLLTQPYAAAQRRGGASSLYQASPEEVEERFGAALAAMPARPSSYLLYFEPGSNTLTPASQAAFVKMRREISERTALEVRVIGHTDRVGSRLANDALSKNRAEAIRDQLIASGVPAESLETVGRGERDLLVPTEDEVDEPRNRRVEINLR